MATEQGDGFILDDRDRLPWLEPADSYERIETVPLQKVAALVLLGVALIGLIAGGGWWLKSRANHDAARDVAVIPAPAGPYKVPATESRAKVFEGEGDSSYAASAGGEAEGRIDASKAPEAPMTDILDTPAPKPTPAASTKTPSKTPAQAGSKDAGKEQGRARAPVPANAAPLNPTVTQASSLPAGARVQLGAYNSEAIAKGAWKRLTQRFEELGGSNYAVEPVTSNGKMLYRLRMAAGSTSEASAVCGKLRVAGESCWVVQ